ncbi:MAG: carbohydrate kinase, partial [Acidobacteria bacterium]|nr:carbohydrate kinase [Acidobacteriota bacterium]
MRIVSAGEILWDVFPGAEHLGGAVFNFTAHARRLGHEVAFVSGVGDDERGRRALRRMEELEIPARFVRVAGEAETGKVTVEVDAAGQPAFTIHRPAAYDFADLTSEELGALLSPPPDWVAFGTLYQITRQGAALTERIVRAAAGSGVFYDVNLRPASYEEGIVHRSLGYAGVVKLNDAEAAELAAMFGLPAEPIGAFARALAERYRLRGVCVTLGERGCVLLLDGAAVEAPGYPVRVADTVGAGDSFSA